MKTISITVTGKVQGVFYRQSTKETARDLGITGFVKNQEDGCVFIIATGTSEQLDQLTGWCRKGPKKAVVNNIAVMQLPLQDFNQFTIDR